jgi:hypothetical protein
VINDSDPDGDPIRLAGASARGARVTATPDGSVRVEVSPRFARASLLVSYVIEDSRGGRAQGRLMLRVARRRPSASPRLAGHGGSARPLPQQGEINDGPITGLDPAQERTSSRVARTTVGRA